MSSFVRKGAKTATGRPGKFGLALAPFQIIEEVFTGGLTIGTITLLKEDVISDHCL
jgi:hypothetical protein